MRLGQYVRPILPSVLQAKVPAYHAAGSKPKEEHQRKVLMLAGCVQPAMMPNINGATRRLLDTLGIQTLEAKTAGCCGAVKFHLNDQEAATQQMRVNIDAWWPSIENQQIEAIVMNASGCGVMVKDYGHVLAGDEAYAEKAKRVSALTKDLSEFLAERCTNTDSWARLQDKLTTKPLARLVYHPPCTLQHGQKLRGGVEQIMLGLGFELTVAAQEAHLCCGSAGTYSVLQPLLAHRLKERKLEHLLAQKPECIVSANIGCISHLQSGTDVPVRHWVEVLDEAIGS
jgi:glycolate oxidase iron-sulfur subunit